MTAYRTTREAYDAYLRGAASWDDVERAVDQSIAKYIERAGRQSTDMVNDEWAQRTKPE